MILKPAFGFDKLLFGMKQADIEALYGKADTFYKDEDDNIILAYNVLKAKLTLYAEEDFRLGYIVISHPETEIFGETIIGKPFETVKNILNKKGFKSWETETNDGIKLYFNEDFWIFFHEEYNEIIKIETGALIKNENDFDWKF